MNLQAPFSPQPRGKKRNLKNEHARKMQHAIHQVWARDKVYGLKRFEVAPCHFCGRHCERGERQGEVHHLKKRSTHPELRYELTNLVIACVRCHREQHS